MMKKLSIASVVGLQLFIQDAFAHGLEEGHHMGPWMMGWGLFPFLIIAVIAIICFSILGRRGGRSPWCGFGDQKDTETPLEILKKRYAKGEISKEEFEAIKKDLE